MKEYVNLEQLTLGCVSGKASEWQVLRVEARQALDEIERLRSELARLKEAAELIGLALRSAKDVLEEVKKQRTYENKNNIVPGGCVSAPLEVCCVRYVRRMNEVNSNPIAAALVEQARKAVRP